jgi:hypothetical protein
MGENTVAGERFIGNFSEKVAFCVKDEHLSFTVGFDCLPSLGAGKLIYVQADAFGYNNCRFNSTLKAALMVKRINGETNHDC